MPRAAHQLSADFNLFFCSIHIWLILQNGWISQSFSVIYLTLPLFPLGASLKCKTVPQAFLLNVPIRAVRGENHAAAANLISEANISAADINEGLQVEMDQISSKTMKAAASLCFASVFLGQNKISLGQVPMGPLLVFWQTPR